MSALELRSKRKERDLGDSDDISALKKKRRSRKNDKSSSRPAVALIPAPSVSEPPRSNELNVPTPQRAGKALHDEQSKPSRPPTPASASKDHSSSSGHDDAEHEDGHLCVCFLVNVLIIDCLFVVLLFSGSQVPLLVAVRLLKHLPPSRPQKPQPAR